MAIRVTGGMMQTRLLNNLNTNLNNLNDLQEQTSTGLKLNRPSDDPSGITYSLRYRSELAYNDQYQSNSELAVSWLNATDSALDEMNEIYTRINELGIQASTETTEQTGLDSIKEELNELKNQLLDIGNTKLNGKYIFNGENFETAPYDSEAAGFDAASVTTDSSSVQYTISSGVTMGVNISGNDIFGEAGSSDNIFTIIDNMTAAIDSGDYEAINTELSNLSDAQSNVSTARSLVGARTNRVELVQSRLETLYTNLTELQSNVEDADYAEVLIKSSSAQSVYEASLSVGSNLLSVSLIDFLK